MVRGLSQVCGERVAAVRGAGPWRSLEAMWRASGASAAAMRALARADAFGSMGLAREQALWQAGRLREGDAPLFEQVPPRAGQVTPRADLPPSDPLLRIAADYQGTGLSLRGHPMSAMRGTLSARGVRPCASLQLVHECPDGSMASVAGIVLLRQKPGTAKGTVFITLEDESGAVNLIVRPKVWKRDRARVRHEPALIARGRVQHRDGVVHLLATRLRGVDRVLDAGGLRAREFR
jgi:error-prone DNA polymerase